MTVKLQELALLRRLRCCVFVFNILGNPKKIIIPNENLGNSQKIKYPKISVPFSKPVRFSKPDRF